MTTPSASASGADAHAAWEALSYPWRLAFEEAWTSWCMGSLAVGAVVTGEDGKVVARGHNQFFHRGPGPISATYMAHAEMNVLAQLPVRRAPYNLYSTYEPCCMCTSAMRDSRVQRVEFAAFDPIFDGMAAWVATAPVQGLDDGERVCLEGVLSSFGYTLHVSKVIQVASARVVEIHEEKAGPLFAFATSSTMQESLGALQRSGEIATAKDALVYVWEDLLRLQS